MSSYTEVINLMLAQHVEEIDEREAAIGEAIEILNGIIKWGYGQIMPLGELIGRDLEDRIITFGSLHDTGFLMDHIDHWESTHREPSQIIQDTYLEVFGETYDANY